MEPCMICAECKSEGKKSKVFPGTTFTTSGYYQPFYDTEGLYHDHDPNYTTTDYSCSNGHTFSNRTFHICVTCGENK